MTRFTVSPIPCLAGALGLALLAGCPAKNSEKVAAPALVSDGGNQSIEAASLTPERITPVIRELAAEGVLPGKLVLEFPIAIASPEQINHPTTEKTSLKLVPEVRGRLLFTGSSTLTFTPDQGFAFDTHYRAVLEKVETREGSVAAPQADAWAHEFSTPKFAFTRLAPAEVDLRGGKVKAELVFSGPVDVASLKKLATFSIDGKAISDVRLATGEESHVVVAQLASKAFHPNGHIQLRLQEGARSSASSTARAPSATGSFELFAGRKMVIHSARSREGSNGFYIDVVCEDEGRATTTADFEDKSDETQAENEGEGENESYDSETGNYEYRPSHGCMIQDTEAADAIHFTPAVKFSVAPARGGFRIFGDFKRGTYSMRIGAGVGSVGGGMLLSDFEGSFAISARKPQVGFGASGRYLPRSAWKNLAITHLNVEAVNLSIRHITAENLVFWLSNESQETADERNSDLVLSKQFPVRTEPDTSVTTWMDVGSMLPSTTRGVLELAVDGAGQHAASRLLLTDMSLVAKKSAALPGHPQSEEVWVWALGIESGATLGGVEVSLVRKSGKVVARCTTSGDNGCKLQEAAADLDSSEPFALIARKGDDLTYLRYSDLKTSITDSDVEGAPFAAEQPYRAALYSDRGVYRPGDTAHLAAVMRTAENIAPPAAMPCELRLTDPQARVVKKVALKTNDAGMVAFDLPFAAFADTGRYNVQLAVANNVVGEYAFNVEEFVPERMKVTAKTAKPGYASSESVPVGVEAKYLFGGSAAGSSVEVNCRLEPSVFKPKENAGFEYGVWRRRASEGKPLTLGQVKGELDDKGTGLFKCPGAHEGASFKGAARLVAQVAVFESGSGRSTQGEVSVAMHPESFYLGLQTGTQKVAAGKAFTVSGVVVDWNGALVTDAKKLQPLEVETMRLEEEYGYTWDEDTGQERYQRYLRPVREGKTTVQVAGGKFSIPITPNQRSAGFLVRVRSGNAQTDLQLEGDSRYYWSGAESRVDQTPKPLKPTGLSLQIPSLVKVGDKVTVTAKAPYPGKILFTAETDHVLTAEWRNATAGEISWSFKLSQFAPNVYVSAFLVKDPHLESKDAFMPDRAFGVASATIEPTAFTQTVALSAPTEVRSNSTLAIDLDLGALDAPTYATIAAVDEGILSLTKFKSPNPSEIIFSKRGLGVETYETIGWTLLVPPLDQRTAGGDEDGKSSQGRVQPVKPVALWSGLVPVPKSGKLHVTFRVPQYRGALRVMAVTAGPKKIGKANATVLVRDPIVLQTTLPRFVAQGDEMEIPVFVTNLSGGTLDVTVSLSAENLPSPGITPAMSEPSPLQLLGKPEGVLKLANEKAGTLVFRAKAVKAIGAAKLRVLAKSGPLESREELDVPFSPSGPRERIVQRIPLEAGTTDVEQYLKGWLPGTEQSTLWVTNNPYGESFDHLRYLVEYPYGCIEQTTSSTRPLLFVSTLLDSVDPTLLADKKLEDMVLYGINRVFSMQTPSGAFGYWPGAVEPHPWGTAYATHMLLDAQKLGYPVPEDRLKDVIAWINAEVTREESGVSNEARYYGYHEAEPYLHYVLALAGQGRKARIQKLIDAQPHRAHVGEEAEEEYMLKAALYLAGDRRYEKELRNPDASPLADQRLNNWSFYSDRQRRGFVLSTFDDLFGNDPAGEALASRVAEGLRAHPSYWYNTQELVWGITGLGKRLVGASQGFTPAELVANGKPLEARAPKTKTSDRTWEIPRASNASSLQLTVKDKGSGALFLILGSSGVREKPDFKLGGNGLSIERKYRTLEGSTLEIHNKPLQLADLVYVQITVSNTSGERISNLALVDRLPAGWEIENPRLGRGAPVEWVKEDSLWKADYMNVRDDRIELFGSLERGETRQVVYAVRAVTAGKFTLPPIEVEAMYDPRLWAREAGGEVKIEGPWADFLL